MAGYGQNQWGTAPYGDPLSGFPVFGSSGVKTPGGASTVKVVSGSSTSKVTTTGSSTKEP